MSPSWRESLHVELGAQELRLARLSRGWRPRVLAEQRRALARSTPDAAGQALADALRALPGASGAPACVVLSGDWVRFALQGDAGALRGTAERHAAAGHALRRVYGDAASRWRWCVGEAGSGTLLVAGIDAALQDSIASALQAAGARLVSMQPALGLAVNRCRRWLAQPSWLVSLEPGLATLAYSDGQRLLTLRTHRLRRSLHDELPVWIEQARLIEGVGEPGAEVTVAYRSAEAGDTAQLKLASRLVAVDTLAFAGAA